MNKMIPELLRHSGEYGAHHNETLSSDFQYRIFNRWLEAEIFKPSLGVFIAQEIHHSLTRGVADNQAAQYTPTTRLYRAILNHIERGEGLGALSASARSFILDEIVLASIPALRFHDEIPPFDEIDPGSIEWGFLNAGLCFADSIGLDSEAMSKDEAIELGRFLQDSLQNKVVPPRHIHFFSLSARLFYLRSSLAEGNDLVFDSLFGTEEVHKTALEAFFAANEQMIQENHPITRLANSLKNFKTRAQLAAQDETANANLLFKEQNNAIAAKFAVVDELLMAQAFDRLPVEETAFIAAAAVKDIIAEFSAFDIYRSQMIARVLPRETYTISLLPNVDLLAAVRGNETRIFALRQTADGYRLTRVDRREDDYYELMTDPITCHKDNDYKLRIFSNAPNARRLKHTGEDSDALAAALMQKHRTSLLAQLHAEGYEETGLEKVQSFLLSLIPFYDCINDCLEGNSRAALSCTIDVLSLVPMAGQGVGMSARLARKSLMGGMLGYRKALGALAVRSTMKSALKTAGMDIVNHALATAATELNQQALIRLGLSMIRTLDPGLELAGHVGYNSVRKVVTLARMLETRRPLWKRLLPELEAYLSRQADHAPASHIKARLAGVPHAIPVVRLDGDKLHGRDIYVRILPGTGEVFGRKYTLSTDNWLTAVPRSLRNRLNNILSEGLSGRGAPLAGRRLAARRSPYSLADRPLDGQPYTLSMANHLMRWMDNQRSAAPMSLAAFMGQYGLTGSRWRFYVDDNGALTHSGRQLLEETGITSWSHLFDLPQELQDCILGNLDAPSLRNIVRAFPALNQEHSRLTSLRNMAQMRLDTLRNDHFYTWTTWAHSGAPSEKRDVVLGLLRTCFDQDQTILDVRGFALTELPAMLPRTLIELNVSGNRLTTLPADLPAGLHKLDVSGNSLETLSATLPASLKILLARQNRLGRLPETLPASLMELDVMNNNMLWLPETLPDRLQTLVVSGNMLENLPARLPGDLKYLTASLNRLLVLPDRLPTFLYHLDVTDNLLRYLPEHLPERLNHLYVDNNRLETLPATLPKKLKNLKIMSNILIELPETLPDGMTHLFASQNLLISLPDALPSKLKFLVAQQNMLTSLPPRLPDSLMTLGLGYNFLESLGDRLPAKLEQLNLRGNRHLALPTVYPPGLKSLDVRECNIVARPDNLPERVVFIYRNEGAPSAADVLPVEGQ